MNGGSVDTLTQSQGRELECGPSAHTKDTSATARLFTNHNQNNNNKNDDDDDNDGDNSNNN
jgi:hypothetical protein